MGDEQRRQSRPETGPAPGEMVTELKEKAPELDKLTVPAALEMLRNKGIKDLEQLVTAAVNKANRGSPRKINLYAPVVEPSPEIARNTVHQKPQVPILIDGTLYDPDDINRFDGQVLHLLHTPSETGEPTLHGYTGTEFLRALNSYFQVRHMLSVFDVGAHPLDIFPPTGPSPFVLPPYPAPTGWPSPLWPQPSPWITPIAPQPSHPPPPPPPPEAKFTEHENFGGDWLWLGSQMVLNDLTEVGRGFMHLSDWNDIITSVDSSIFTVDLYEHINFVGSSLHCAPHSVIPNLGVYGWNDRASSIKNLG